MLKNKIIVRKIRNIVILLMAVIVMIGAYKNIRDSLAENVLEIELQVADKTNTLSSQTMVVEARETSDGNYLLELPLSVNGNIVTKYYTPEGEEIEIKYDGDAVTLQLTEDEVTNKKVQLGTNYDTKEVTYNEETKTLYNKELKYNEEVIITGYMPLDSQLEIKEIDKTTLANVKLSNENQTIQKGYDISVFETIEKTVETVVDGVVNTTVEIEKIEYNPSVYEQQLQVSINYKKDSGIEQTVIINSLDDNSKLTKIESTLENENIIFKSNSILDKYVVVVENVQTSVDKPSNNIMMFQTQENTSNIEMNSTTTYSTEVNTAATSTNTLANFSSETSATSAFWGNTVGIQRQNVSTLRFLVGQDEFDRYNLANMPSWNVDEGKTGSIKAYYQDWSTSSANDGYHIWIYSENKIYANANSSYLFAHLGYSKYYSYNGVSQVVYGLNYVDTSNVTNMSHMFYNTGRVAMTKLDLTDSFTVSNKVTNMSNMFNGCGYTAMTELYLGKGFEINSSADYTGLLTDMGKSGCVIYCWPELYSHDKALRVSVGSSSVYYSRGTVYCGPQLNFDGNGFDADFGYYFSETVPFSITVTDTKLTQLPTTYKYCVVSSQEYSNGLFNSTPNWKTVNFGDTVEIGDGLNGSYYLLVQSVSGYNGYSSRTKSTGTTTLSGGFVKMSDGTSTAWYHAFGYVKFDKTAPTITVSPTQTTNSSANNYIRTSQSITITASDEGGAGLATSNEYKYYVSKNSNSLTTGSWTGDTWTTYTSGTSFSINPGVSGTYYLFVKTVKDDTRNGQNGVTGNVSSTNGTMVTIDSVKYHRFGPYKFDYDKPTITLSSNSNTTWAKEHSVTVTLSDSYSGLVAGSNIGLKYGWSTSRTTAPTNYTTVSLSNSAGATSTTFTAEGSGITGEYYLWVVPASSKYVKDRAGNSNTTSVKSTGTFYFDNTAPTIELAEQSNNEWSKTHSVEVTLSDSHSGLVAGSNIGVRYGWAELKDDGTVTAPASYTTVNLSNSAGQTSTSFTAEGSGLTGKYHLWVEPISSNYLKDTLGNTNNTKVESTGTFWFDNTAPTIELSKQNSNNQWSKTHSVEVTLSDLHSGLVVGSNIGLRYGWAELNDDGTVTEPTSYTTVNLSNSAGATSTTFTANGSGITGKYHLWVEPISSNYLKDTLGNTNNTKVESTGTFWFDNTAPTWTDTQSPTVEIPALEMKLGNASGNDYENGTWTNQNIYIAPVNGNDAHSGHATTTYTVKKNGTNLYQNITGVKTLNPGTNVEATYTITVTTTDNAGNTATSEEYTVKIDKIKPTWTYVSKDIYYETSNDVGTDDYTNAERTVKIVFKGTDTNAHEVTSNLTRDDITVSVNGITVPNENKTLEIINDQTLEKTYELTITGIEPIDESGNIVDGILTVEISSGKLTDEAGNQNSATNLTTYIDIDVDNTNPNLDLQVTSPSAGTYKAGQEITITVTYNENIYKEITSNTLIDTKEEAPIMSLKFGGAAAKGTVVCDNVNGNIFTYKYTITGADNPEGNNGDNGTLTISLEPVYDIAGNEVSVNGVDTEIVADTIIPTLTIISDKEEPTNAEIITYTFTFSEIVTGFTAEDVNINNGTKGTFSGSGSTYTLEVLTVDNLTYDQTVTVADGVCTDIAGNENTGANHTIKVDRTDPTITITPNKTTNAVANDYVNTQQNVTITATDDYSGLDTDNEYKYYVLNSEESEAVLETVEWQEYADGQTIILNPGISGQYYIYVKPIRDNVTDDNKNISTTENYHKIGPYKFDYDSPTITVEPTSKQWTNSEVSVTVTSVDIGGAGLQSSNGEYFLSTNTNPTEVATGATVSGTYTNGTPFNIKPETTGEYYLFVKQISDNLGNIANTTDYVTIDGVVYHRYGIYQFDLTAPEWTVKNVTINDDKTVTAQIEGIDNHSGCASSTLEEENITVKIDGVTANITKELTADEELENTYILTLSDFEQEGGLQADKKYLEWSGTISIEIAEGTLTDNAGNVNNDDECTLGFADFIKPIVIYKYSESDINKTDKKFTMTFDITDKYFASSSFATELAAATTDAEKLTVLKQYLTITIDGTDITEVDEVTKKIISVSDVTAGTVGNPINKTISGVLQTGLTNQVVGKRYTLELSNLEQAGIIEGDDYLNYSGVVSVSIKEGTAIDNGPKGDGANPNGNVSGTTSTIISGVDNPSSGAGSSEQIVDLVDPIWTAQDFSITNNVVTVKLNATDKYFDFDSSDSSTLTTNDITAIKINNDDITSGVTNLSISNTVTTLEYGRQYTLTFTLPDLESEDFGGGYVEFSDGTIVGGNAKYREESINGPIKITIAGGTIVDEHENEWKEKDVQIGLLNASTKPEIFEVQSTSNPSAKTETIIFNVTDKYYNTEEEITVGEDTDGDGTPDQPDEIKVYIDGEEVTGVKKEISKIPITYTPEGETEGTVVGHQYTLVLSEFEQTTSANDLYTNHSGTVSIKIEQDAIKDPSNNGNEEKTIIGDFIDFIKPEIRYQYFGTSRDETPNANPDIDYTNKTFKMEFSVTDKYMYLPTAEEIAAGQTNQLTLDDLEIKINSGKLDSDGNVIEYDLKQVLESVGDEDCITFATPEEIKVTNVKVTTNKTDKTVETVTEKVIGYKYVITITNLEQLEKAIGATTLDYSGFITVAIAENKVKDDSNNTNDGKTITSGLNTPNGEGSGVVVDVVDPIWESAGTTIDFDNLTAQIKINATDTYFANSILNTDNIELIAIRKEVDEETGENIEQELTEVEISETITALTETRLVNETETTVQYGNQYILNVTGIPEDIYKLTLKIDAGQKDDNGQLTSGIIDNSGNINKDITLNLINYLRIAGEGSPTITYETAATSGFLGNTAIQRQNIEKVTFENSTAGSKGENVKGVWDVSADGDKSILAWYTERVSSGTTIYQVYIGSDGAIFANPDSSYLFAEIGTGAKCSETQTIANIGVLNTYNTTNMTYMFSGTGKTSMESLELGDNFITKNVTDMSYMFMTCGQKNMTKLDLGTKFDTSNVTVMPSMFNACGENKLKTLNLGDKFNTSNVNNMHYMFAATGKLTLQNIYFGTEENIPQGVITFPDNFNTSNVTRMSYMFFNFGYETITELNLGNNFNTSKVVYMQSMFSNTGYKLMTKLDLGDKFDTSKVTYMSNMFNNCGYESMTSLDLGENFDTRKAIYMQGMFENTGYTSMTSLDLGDKFYTPSATNMTNMFKGCGATEMTVLDLGPAFTIISTTNTDFLTNCGNSGTTIYVAESIYKDSTHLRLNTNSTTTIEYTIGAINPIYKPELEKESTSLQIDNSNIDNSTMTIILNAVANKVGTPISQINYTSDVVIEDTSKILVYLEGKLDGDTNNNGILDEGETPKIGKNVTVNTRGSDLVDGNITYKTNGDIYLKIGGQSKIIGKQYKIVLSDFNESVRQSGKSFKEWSGNISLGIEKGTLKDKYGCSKSGNVVTVGLNGNANFETSFEDAKTDHNANGTMFADFIKPEFTYTYSETDINHGNESVKVVFDVTDKYYQSTSIDEDNITIKVDNYDEETVNDSISKQLTKIKILVMNKETGVVTAKETDYTVQETEKIVGERFELIITELDQEDANGIGDGFLYSGPMSLGFEQGVITDKSGNTNNATTIAIGINENDGNANEDTIHGTGVIVDVVDPVWKVENIQQNVGATSAESTVTMDLIASDKYYASNTLTPENVASNITVKVNGQAVSTITRTLSGPIETTATGVKYTLTLSNWAGPNTTFTDTDSKTRKYREYSGTTQLVIEGDTISDQYGNKSNLQTLELGHIDVIKPEIERVSSEKDYTAKTETIVFTVTDKYFDTTSGNEITSNEISVYIDNNIVDSVDKSTANPVTDKDKIHKELSHTEIKENGVVVGHEYTLILSNFENTSRNANEYKDFSGTVKIDIGAGAVQDTKGCTNNLTTINGDFVDFIKPDIRYEYQTSDINRADNTYQMTFSITDKYYTSGILTAADIANGNIEILMQNGQLDGDGNPIIYNLKDENVTISLSSTPTEIRVPSMNKTNTSGLVEENVTNQLIGHRYTLTIEDLEKTKVGQGLTTADYSGVISLIIKEDLISDRTVDGKENKNDEKTITSVVSMPDETTSNVVDVVAPIWEKSALTVDIEDKTADITVKGTDTYFATGALSETDILIYIDGQLDGDTNRNGQIDEGETPSIEKSLSLPTDLEEDRLVNGEIVTKQYGVQYTISLTNLPIDKNQVKIKIADETLVDESGNKNETKYINIYSTLLETNTETAATSGLLGSDNAYDNDILPSKIERQNIEKITFENSIFGSTGADVKGVWDVSLNQDDSILAWYTEREIAGGTKIYQVYIGSDGLIFANPDSSYLFSYIGYSGSCAETQTLNNIERLNTINVTKMNYMFNYFGFKKMIELNLGSNFNTYSVTEMEGMFYGTGKEVMTTINLGSLFDTSNVETMKNMFNQCGTKQLTSLNLGSNFDTIKVTDMRSMFNSCGMNNMTTLNLGNDFDTRNVKDMTYMFAKCGTVKMTSLDLGDKFYTTSVEDNPSTGVVEGMNNMFLECGKTVMTSLDLGPAFTRISTTNTDFLKDCGNSETTIYVAESIYSDSTNLKLDTNSTTTIEYTQGTINAKYKTEWIKTSVDVRDDKTIRITLRGRTSPTTPVTDYISDVTSTIPTGVLTGENAELIKVYIDGTELTGITKQVEAEIQISNESTGAKDILQTIILSDFEEDERRAGKPFKEWSGNITLKIAKGTLKDKYGSSKSGTIVTVGENGNGNFETEFKDATNWTSNEDTRLFTDFIKPEFTYEYYNTEIEGDTDANTVIDYVNNKITVVFDVTDKYFKESTLATDTTASQITVKVDEDEVNSTVNVTKTLAKKTLDEDKVVGNITYKTNGDIYYTINGTSQKIGERYELVVSGLETSNGVGYSGPMTLAFTQGAVDGEGNLISGMIDQSGNLSDAKTITIGIDEPSNHPEHDEEVIVDVVNPRWLGLTDKNSIDRTNNTVSIKILGSDKYYKTNTLETSKIKVYVDLNGNGTIENTEIANIATSDMTLTQLTTEELTTLATEAGLTDVKVGYTLTIGGFGTLPSDISGITRIKIDDNTIEDNSENKNVNTDPIYAGNDEWTETGDDSTTPIYPAFRNDIVDFIKPVITYQYSSIMVDTDDDGVADTEISENPDIDYEEKTVTVKFKVLDKYLRQSDLIGDSYVIQEDGVDVTKHKVKNINVIVDGQDVTNLVTTDITADSNDITDGEIVYTLIVSNLQQTPNNAFDFSGPMQLVFAENVIDDTSGNKNSATAITIDTDDGDSNINNGIIVDVVDPIWELGTISLDNGTIELIAKDKFFKTCTLSTSDIIVYVNNAPSAIVGKDITTIPPTNIYDTVNGVENTIVGKKYTLKLSNITPTGGGYTEFTPTNQAELVVGEGFKYKTENGGHIAIQIKAGTIEDTSGNKNLVKDFDIGTIDATKPEIYEVQKIQKAPEVDDDGDGNVDSDANTETIIFNVTDRNYDSTDFITKEEIELFIDNVKLDDLKARATLTKKEIKANIDNTIRPVGHQYTLVIPNIAETEYQAGKSYLENSGTLEVRIKAEAAKDLKGNKNEVTSIRDFIDFIKPEIQQVTVANPKNTTDKTYTMSFTVKDKYLDTTDKVTENDITVYIDGETVTAIAKPETPEGQEANKDKLWMELSSSDITAEFNKTNSGTVDANGKITSATITNGTYTIGHTYTLVLSNFEQSEKQASKNFMEWSGTVKIKVAQNAVKDKNPITNTVINNSDEKEINGEHVDFIKPIIENTSSERGTNTETIYFDVIDKYLKTPEENGNENVIEIGDFIVYVDGEAVSVDYTNSNTSGLDGLLTKVQDYKATVNGNTEHIVGQRYKLVLSNFEQASRNAQGYKDLSGTVSIEITQNAVQDTSGNKLDSAIANRTVTGDFVDFIKPDIRYIHQSTDINKGNNTYTMTFSITDKYYDQGVLNLTNNIDIKIKNGQVDANGNEIEYDLKTLLNNNIAFNETPYYAGDADDTINVTNKSTGIVETIAADTHQIGHIYTLTISNLDQLKVEGTNTTANYSGIITVVVDGEVIKDRGSSGTGTNPNMNVEKSITSGVDIPDGIGNGIVVDVVNPVFDKISSSANAIDPVNPTSSTATITFKGTDTYFDVDESTLTTDDIQVVVDGEVVTSGITKTITDTEELEEDRMINGVIQNDVQYGIKYTLQITGWAQNANQVKIRILGNEDLNDNNVLDEGEDANGNGTLDVTGPFTDESGNYNKVTEMIIYNCLELTSSETSETNKFLDGNGLTETLPITGIERQDIQQVIFVESLAGASGENVKTVWDVSAMTDGSIKAWTEQTSAPYTVYIGSDNEIFANQNSSYLFANIGSGSSCTATEVITGIELLNVNSVTNMSNMFNGCGAKSMITLNLGTKFNTYNVTDMSSMFEGCGQSEMTTLTLGANFNTAKVTNMSGMFKNCGQNKLTALELGSQFITNEVTNMSSMFEGCGQSEMTALTLGANFNTGKVTNMSNMFKNCGQTNLSSLDLGSQFNTSLVVSMDSMFEGFGTTALTSLDLGDLFYTTSATSMNNMFKGCGTTTMTVLDLGPAFTRIASQNTDFMKDCGTIELVIYAPESIYSNKTSFKLNN